MLTLTLTLTLTLASSRRRQEVPETTDPHHAPGLPPPPRSHSWPLLRSFASGHHPTLPSPRSPALVSPARIRSVYNVLWQVGTASAFQYKVLVADQQMLEDLITGLEALDDVVRVLRDDMANLLHDLGSDGFWESARAP
jgi:hypothetical protein